MLTDMKNILIVITLSFVSGVVLGQNIETDTISWNVTLLADERTNAQEEYACEFVTFGTTKILWVQKNLSDEFHITASSGSLVDASQDGSRIFSFQYYNKPANLTFSIDDGMAKIRMEVIENHSNVMTYLFTVSNIQKR